MFFPFIDNTHSVCFIGYQSLKVYLVREKFIVRDLHIRRVVSSSDRCFENDDGGGGSCRLFVSCVRTHYS